MQAISTACTAGHMDDAAWQNVQRFNRQAVCVLLLLWCFDGVLALLQAIHWHAGQHLLMLLLLLLLMWLLQCTLWHAVRLLNDTWQYDSAHVVLQQWLLHCLGLVCKGSILSRHGRLQLRYSGKLLCLKRCQLQAERQPLQSSDAGRCLSFC